MKILNRSKTTAAVPSGFVFMKIGTHAGESFEEILERKQREIEMAGRSFWGYGGTSCHPLTQVQPFARNLARSNAPVYLFMEYIHSTADPDIVPATEFSADSVNWEPIPEGISVIGSRYALVLDEIRPGELEIPFEQFEVGIGKSRGKRASDYIAGHVDKACLVRTTGSPSPKREQKIRKISYIAKLVEPYGVLLR
jgi:hypothetical protein